MWNRSLQRMPRNECVIYQAFSLLHAVILPVLTVGVEYWTIVLRGDKISTML